MRKTTWMVTVGAGLLVATAAWAVSVQEVQASAEDALARVQVIQDDAEACPGGECAEAEAIVAAFTSLQPDLATLRDDRASLGSCSCATLDEYIAQVETINDEVRIVLGGWDDFDL